MGVSPVHCFTQKKRTGETPMPPHSAQSYNKKADDLRKLLRGEGKKELLFRLSLRRAIASSIGC